MQPVIHERLEAIKTRRRVVLLLIFLGLIALLIFAFRAVLMPFLVALFVAYLIDPVVDRMELLRLPRGKTLGRGPSILILYTAFLFLLYLAARFTIPAMAEQVQQIQRDIPRAQAFLQDKVQDGINRWREIVKPKEPPKAPAPPPKEAPKSRDSAPLEPARVRFSLKGGGSIVGKVLERTEGAVFLRVGERIERVDRAEIDREEPIARERVLVKGDPPKEVKGEILARRGGVLTLDTGAEVMNIPESEIAEEEMLTEITEEAALDVKLLIARGSEEIVRNIEQLLGFALAVARWVVMAVYETFLIMMLTAFLVIDREPILRFLKSVPTEHHRGTWKRLLVYIDRGLAGVIRGQLLVCLVNGILTWVGLQFLGVSYPLLLGLVAGILSLIPIFGTILSTIPIVLIAWGTSGPQLAFFSLLWILAIHFIEANFLNPKIMGTASKIHPVVIIFALLAGEHTYGIVGALLAVPAASILQSLFRFYVIDRQTEVEEAPGQPA